MSVQATNAETAARDADWGPCAAYVPRLLLQDLAEAGAPVGEGRAARAFPAAVLWVDISGFTPLTARMAAQGARGAERVTEVLNRCFADLLGRIGAAGGDLIDFAGDAVLALWPAAARDGREAAHALREAVTRATACALDIQRESGLIPLDGGLALRLYAGVAAGSVQVLHTGGVDGRWRLLVAGSPLAQLSSAMALCGPGEVVLSPDAWSEVSARLRGTRLAGGFARIDWDGAAAPLALPPLVPVLPPATAIHALRGYLTEALLQRIDAGQRDWLSELRLVSVLFVNLPGLQLDEPAEREAFLAAVRAVQHLLKELEGSLNQIMMDDTGVVILIAFGLPGSTHEDDAWRAAQAALQLRARLAALGLDCRCGVATEKAFCGSYGTPERKRYAMVGAVVNRAARLALASAGEVLADAATHDGAAARMDFEALPPIHAKGLDEPVAVYRPLGTRSALPRAGAAATLLAGRAQEREQLLQALARAQAGADGALVLLEGEAGIGKSALLAQVHAAARQRGIQPLLAQADAVEHQTTYFAWRAVFWQLLGLVDAADDAERVQRVLARVAAAGGRAELAPLSNVVLGLAMPETDITRHMTSRDRGDATRELLVQLLDHAAGETPVLLLEDLHWFDSASLALLLALHQRMPRALFVATTRPLDDAPDAAALLAGTGATRLPLAELPRADMARLVSHTLQVEPVPEPLLDLLYERGEGHPLFTEELVLLLREMGVVRVEAGQCLFEAADPRLTSLDFPQRVEGLIATRIDRLEPSRQLALKVASVIGRSFELGAVREIHPIEQDRDGLPACFADLARPRLVDPEAAAQTPAYIFRHVVIREVAYGLIAYAQRRQLHRRAAALLEAAPEQERERNAPLLAHHYLKAEDYPRCVDTLELAGMAALHRGAAREALNFFGTALQLLDTHAAELGHGASTLRRAQFLSQMGEAANQLLDIPASRGHFNRALELLGLPQPQDAEARSALLRQNLWRQLGHLVTPRWLRRRPSAPERMRFTLAAGICGTIAEQAYFNSNSTESMLYSLQSVNLAERARQPAAAARSYATLAHIMGLMNVKPLLRRYRRRAGRSPLGRNIAFLELEQAARAVAAGRWDEAIEGGRRAAERSAQYADKPGICQGWACVASASILSGRVGAASMAAGHIEAAGRPAYAMAVLAAESLLTGEPQAALERYAALPQVEAAMAMGHAVSRAMWQWQQGHLAQAEADADAALLIAEGFKVPNPFQLSGLSNLVELFLAMHEQARVAGAFERATRALAVLQRYARVYPIGRCRLHRLRAAMARVSGDAPTARRALQQALREAERLQMAPDVGLVELENARLGGPEAAGWLARARATFSRLQLHGLLARCDDLPGGHPP